MLTETLLRISFSVIGRCPLVPTSHWLQGKCAKINLSHPGDFTESQAVSVCSFSVKITALGLLDRFSKLGSQGSKLKLELDFLINKEQKIVKTISS
jgi:hypothetical protein